MKYIKKLFETIQTIDNYELTSETLKAKIEKRFNDFDKVELEKLIEKLQSKIKGLDFSEDKRSFTFQGENFFDMDFKDIFDKDGIPLFIINFGENAKNIYKAYASRRIYVENIKRQVFHINGNLEYIPSIFLSNQAAPKCTVYVEGEYKLTEHIELLKDCKSGLKNVSELYLTAIIPENPQSEDKEIKTYDLSWFEGGLISISVNNNFDYAILPLFKGNSKTKLDLYFDEYIHQLLCNKNSFEGWSGVNVEVQKVDYLILSDEFIKSTANSDNKVNFKFSKNIKEIYIIPKNYDIPHIDKILSIYFQKFAGLVDIQKIEFSLSERDELSQPDFPTYLKQKFENSDAEYIINYFEKFKNILAKYNLQNSNTQYYHISKDFTPTSLSDLNKVLILYVFGEISKLKMEDLVYSITD